MDGLKGVVPNTCKQNEPVMRSSLFGEIEDTEFCSGCQKENIREHNGVYCLIRDWGVKDPQTEENNRKIRFIDLIKQ